MSKPLALSDDQMTMITRAAEPLQPADRGPFLQRVATLLNGHELGDGVSVERRARRRKNFGGRRWKLARVPVPANTLADVRGGKLRHACYSANFGDGGLAGKSSCGAGGKCCTCATCCGGSGGFGGAGGGADGLGVVSSPAAALFKCSATIWRARCGL
jgi:hypothetical protein